MKNTKAIQIAKEVTESITRNTKVSVVALATKLVHALQPIVVQETGVAANQVQEQFMSELLLEQFEKVYAAYGNKDRISEKRLLEGKRTIVEVASAVYSGDVVDGSTSLERGERYCLDVIERSVMDSFRDQRNKTADTIANIVRAIDDPELYYYIEAMLPVVIENVIISAKAHLKSQDEIVDSIDSIAGSIVDSIMKDKETLALFVK